MPKTITLPLYVLIQRTKRGDLFRWEWFVTSERTPDGERPILEALDWDFASTRWSARWGAKRACLHLDPNWRRPAGDRERWIYDPAAQVDGPDSQGNGGSLDG